MFDTKRRDELVASFREFVAAADFPCVGAKAALGRDQISFAVARDIRSNWNDVEIASQLRAFARSYTAEPALYRSFVVLFAASGLLSEAAFESHMWHRLQSFSDKDSCFGAESNVSVSADPDSPHFGLSYGGEAFFVVGLHPGASRPGRCFKHAALVFNAHEQFTRLRVEGKYETLRRTIIARDVKLAGCANPMLARHGEISEARQYSGRAVAPDWECPFAKRDFSWANGSVDRD